MNTELLSDLEFMARVSGSEHARRIAGQAKAEIERLCARVCEDCQGTGTVHVKSHPDGIEVDGERPCECLTRHIDIVFDGPPGPEAGRFVEVENSAGVSIRTAGEWLKRPDGYWVLRLPQSAPSQFSGTRRQAEREAETEVRNRLELSRVQALDPGDRTGAFRND